VTDEELARQLHALKAQGPTAAPEIVKLVKTEGGWSRIIGLIPAPKKKRPPSTSAQTFLPDDFPDEAAKTTAITYWTKHNRADLCGAIERIVDDFRAHHGDPVTPTRAKSWPRTWTTWYRNQVNFIRAPSAKQTQSETVIFEQTTIEGWVKRLEIFYNPERPGIWSGRWSFPPDDPRNKVPPEALAQFNAAHPEQRQKA
jgi:hypothetical protein